MHLFVNNSIFLAMRTQRQFKEVNTGVLYYLHCDQYTNKTHLENDEGEQINAYFYNARTTTTVKTNKRTVSLNVGQFLHIEPGETLTHQKYLGRTKFSKI